MAKKKPTGFVFSPECFTLTLDVYPPIAIGRENALMLATDLAVHQDLTDIHMSDESWTFRRPQIKGQSRGHIQVAVESQEISIEHQSPVGGLERFEILVDQTVEAIGHVIKPQMVFGFLVVLEYSANIGQDARKAILGSLEMLGDDEDDGKLGAFERPCHFVGLRLGFPPFHYEPTKKDTVDDDDKPENPTKTPEAGEIIDKLIAEKGEDVDADDRPPKGSEWGAMITIQSLQDDPKGISVEVSGRWMGAIPWEECKKSLSLRLKTVDEFLKTKTTEFLQQFRSEE